MTAHFTKDEIAQLFKEFLFVIGSDLPEGHIKAAWQRYMEVKKQEKWKADMEALVEEGHLEAVYDEQDDEWRYAPTERGLASLKRGVLERLG